MEKTRCRARRSHTGGVPFRYFDMISCNEREAAYAQAWVRGYLHAAPVLMSASSTRLREVLIKLAMDATEESGYRFGLYRDLKKRERAIRRQAFCLMGMPRVQSEIERIMERQGMSRERMAARLAEIMEGRATSETRVFDGDGNLTERRVQTASVAESMRAIDITIRATTGYAPTKARVALGMDGMTMYDAQEWKEIPEIAIDPDLAIETKFEKELALEDEEDAENGDDDTDDDEYDDKEEAA